MIAGTESFRLAVPDPLNLAAEHHDPGIEIVRMRVTRDIGAPSGPTNSERAAGGQAVPVNRQR
jgi:hypothetical protein